MDNRLLGTYNTTNWENSRTHLLFHEIEWLEAMMRSTVAYNNLMKDAKVTDAWKPEQARSVLPNSLKTEIVVTTNLRDWRHIFHLRCDKTAHPQMRELMIPLYNELVKKCPVIFDSVKFN
jgi:thymidylate synthase (FAD)